MLLHVSLVATDGIKSIISSRKKMAEAEWPVLTETLVSMGVTWRDLKMKRTGK